MCTSTCVCECVSFSLCGEQDERKVKRIIIKNRSDRKKERRESTIIVLGKPATTTQPYTHQMKSNKNKNLLSFFLFWFVIYVCETHFWWCTSPCCVYTQCWYAVLIIHSLSPSLTHIHVRHSYNTRQWSKSGSENLIHSKPNKWKIIIIYNIGTDDENEKEEQEERSIVCEA